MKLGWFLIIVHWIYMGANYKLWISTQSSIIATCSGVLILYLFLESIKHNVLFLLEPLTLILPTASTCQRDFFTLRILLAFPLWSGCQESPSMLPQLLGYAIVSHSKVWFHAYALVWYQHNPVTLFHAPKYNYMYRAAEIACSEELASVHIYASRPASSFDLLNFLYHVLLLLFCACSNFHSPLTAGTCFSVWSVSSCHSSFCLPFSTLLECLSRWQNFK